MLFRGVGARRLVSFTIFLLTVLVVSGAVVATGFARATGVPQGSAGALVLLGLVGIATQAVESVRRREPDLALARLRGRHGPRLLLFAVAEPGVVVVGGAVVGVGVGWLLTRAVFGAWLPTGTSYTIGRREWTTVAIITLAVLVIVAASCWSVLRAPLHSQLAGARRPRGAGTVGLFLQLLLILGAVIALYQSQQAVRSRVDWVTLISPAVVGLAIGQLAIWLVVVMLIFLIPRTTGARLGWFVTLRRLLRRADGLAVIRVVVAAGVVLGVAVSASTAAQSWRVERAKLQIGAPVSYPVQDGALRAYAAAHTADPDGSWLLPVASYTADRASGSRRVFVEASRWKNVVGGFFDGTSSASLSSQLEKLPAPPSRVFARGDTVTAVVPTDQLAKARNLSLTIQYVDDAGDLTVTRFPLRSTTTAGGGLSRQQKPLAGCHDACSPVELDISGFWRGPLDLVSVGFAGEPLLAPKSGIQLADHPYPLHVGRKERGLRIRIPGYAGHADNIVATFHPGRPQALISTLHTRLNKADGESTVAGVDGADRAVVTIGKASVLPFVGTRGSMLDLGQALIGSGGSVPETRAVVLARADTPASVLAALRATGAVGAPTTYADALAHLSSSPRAEGTRLYTLVAVFAVLIALVTLASTVAQQTVERRLEAASLRSVGVPRSAIRDGFRR